MSFRRDRSGNTHNAAVAQADLVIFAGARNEPICP